MKKLLFLFLIVFVICNASYISKNAEPTEEVVTKANSTIVAVPLSDKTKVPDTVSIIGAGDIMLGSNYPNPSYLPNKNQNILFNVEDTIESADISCANYEGVFLDKGKSSKNCSECFSFRTPENYAKFLKGFTFISLANNHSNDFGSEGCKNTIKSLTENKISFAGLKGYPYSIVEKNGVKFGFCAFGPDGYGGIEHFNDALVVIKELKKKCDIVIVNFHAGAEGQNAQHVTRKTEYFLGENRGDPYHLAREAIDAGADIVFMEGPHVTRAIDLYKNRFIAYSLGDFATYGQFNVSGVYGIAPAIKVVVNSHGEFQKGYIYSIKQIGKGVPIVDKDKAVIKKIIELTKSDIPESSLLIKENGVIEIIKKEVKNDYF
jgi:hypothetical protein